MSALVDACSNRTRCRSDVHTRPAWLPTTYNKRALDTGDSNVVDMARTFGAGLEPQLVEASGKSLAAGAHAWRAWQHLQLEANAGTTCMRVRNDGRAETDVTC
jgi:hypothetical protein